MTNMPASEFRNCALSVPAPVIVIMPRAGMILVEVIVQVPQRAMVCTVLGGAVETILMRAPVRFSHFTVELPVLRMIACVAWALIKIDPLALKKTDPANASGTPTGARRGRWRRAAHR